MKHRTVLAHEAVCALNIKKDGVYVDATYGRGGHSSLIVEALGENGRLIALDKDPDAILHAKKISDKRFSAYHLAFCDIATLLSELGIEKIDGILLDLGVSSPQLDDPKRGFSFRYPESKLDMRMNPESGLSVREWLKCVSEAELARVLRDYGEERYANRIAKLLCSKADITTVADLLDIVNEAIPVARRDKNPATRTFQALRIAVNGEMEELRALLALTPKIMRAAARLVVIAFHSLEDRIVKEFINRLSRPAPQSKRLPLVKETPILFDFIAKVKPSTSEIESNQRARSAIMRVAERTCTPYIFDGGFQ